MEKEEKKKKIRNILLIAILGIVVDQSSKIFLRSWFSSNIEEMLVAGGEYLGLKVIPNRGVEIIHNFFYIISVKNTGGAWGIFSGNVFFLALISLFIVFLLYFYLRKEEHLNKIAITYYGFLFGGIIGNLIDRLLNGYVTDFLNFYIFGYDYPVFNIADILIVVGVILMVIDDVRGEVYAYQKRKGKS